MRPISPGRRLGGRAIAARHGRRAARGMRDGGSGVCARLWARLLYKDTEKAFVQEARKFSITKLFTTCVENRGGILLEQTQQDAFAIGRPRRSQLVGHWITDDCTSQHARRQRLTGATRRSRRCTTHGAPHPRFIAPRVAIVPCDACAKSEAGWRIAKP